MAVPKRKVSKTRRDTRRAHDALVFSAAVEACPNCTEYKERHHICLACGQYRGRQVFEIKTA